MVRREEEMLSGIVRCPLFNRGDLYGAEKELSMLTYSERQFVNRLLDHPSPERLAKLIHHPYVSLLLSLRARELRTACASTTPNRAVVSYRPRRRVTT